MISSAYSLSRAQDNGEQMEGGKKKKKTWRTGELGEKGVQYCKYLEGGQRQGVGGINTLRICRRPGTGGRGGGGSFGGHGEGMRTNIRGRGRRRIGRIFEDWRHTGREQKGVWGGGVTSVAKKILGSTRPGRKNPGKIQEKPRENPGKLHQSIETILLYSHFFLHQAFQEYSLVRRFSDVQRDPLSFCSC